MTAPAVKWAGGKTRLLPELHRRLPGDVHKRRHVELFAGGGALFFARQPARALLADKCLPLVEVYMALQAAPESVLRSLRGLVQHHGPDHYYAVRERFNAGRGKAAQMAAMFIYLNRAGFNGLYRQNSAGHLNVPFGRHRKSSLYRADELRRCASALERVHLRAGDFQEVARWSVLGKGDFVYLDPPYAPTSETSFAGYLAGGFTHDDHIRLRDLVRTLDRDGAKVMVSQADTIFTRDIYREFRVERVTATRSISRKASSRGPVHELVIRNYDGSTRKAKRRRMKKQERAV